MAKAIGYMINANSTVGGGCPVPPPPTGDLTRFGAAMADAINGANNKSGLWVGESLASVAAGQSSKNITVASLEVHCSPLAASPVQTHALCTLLCSNLANVSSSLTVSMMAITACAQCSSCDARSPMSSHQGCRGLHDGSGTTPAF